jgi:hypothetical protein
MSDPSDLELVYRAILSRCTGDCEWDDKAARIARSNPDLSGLTPEGISELLRDHVAASGRNIIDRRPEIRPEWNDREYWYRVIVPVEQFTHGLFVEIILVNDDPEAPAVQIVSAHEQRK